MRRLLAGSLLFLTSRVVGVSGSAESTVYALILALAPCDNLGGPRRSPERVHKPPASLADGASLAREVTLGWQERHGEGPATQCFLLALRSAFVRPYS